MRRLLEGIFERREARFFLTGVGMAGFFFVVSYSLARAGLRPFASSSLAYVSALGLGYLTQRNWSFRARHPHASALPRYLSLQAGCAVTSGLSAQAATTFLNLSPLPMSILNTALMGLISYVVSSNWVFPDDQDPK